MKFPKIIFIYLIYNKIKISFKEIISKNEIFICNQSSNRFSKYKMILDKIVNNFTIEIDYEDISPFSTRKMVASWPNCWRIKSKCSRLVSVMNI